MPDLTQWHGPGSYDLLDPPMALTKEAMLRMMLFVLGSSDHVDLYGQCWPFLAEQAPWLAHQRVEAN